jgi:hypothetical protein
LIVNGRANAVLAAAVSEGDARHRGLLRRRPKLFPDLHKGAVDGCLGRNAQFVDDEKKLPLCQHRFEQKKFLAIPADFGAIARTCTIAASPVYSELRTYGCRECGVWLRKKGRQKICSSTRSQSANRDPGATSVPFFLIATFVPSGRRFRS